MSNECQLEDRGKCCCTCANRAVLMDESANEIGFGCMAFVREREPFTCEPVVHCGDFEHGYCELYPMRGGG